MRIVLTRKEHQCSFEHCCFGRIIKKGSISITQLLKGGRGYFVLHFHPDCFIQSTLQYINSKVEALEKKKAERNKSKERIGRPRKYSDLMGARNLVSLLAYHKKAGNRDRVGEIETKLKRMEVDND